MLPLNVHIFWSIPIIYCMCGSSLNRNLRTYIRKSVAIIERVGTLNWATGTGSY